MTTRTGTILIAALCLSGTIELSSQSPVTKSASVTGTATIQAIDSTARTITLRDEERSGRHL